MVQTTIVQLDNYGPWTVTPKPRLESSILSFQSEAYAFLVNAFAMYDSLTLNFRQDTFLVLSSGVSIAQHRRIQTAFNDRYAVSTSMAISRDSNPYLAQIKATKLLHAAGSAQDPSRLETLVFDFKAGTADNEAVQIGHFDLNNITQTHTDKESAYDVHQYILQAQTALTNKLAYYNGTKIMLFFIGGDNFVSLTTGKTSDFFQGIIDDLLEEGFDFKVGVGNSTHSLFAMDKANRALEKIRNESDSNKVIFIR